MFASTSQEPKLTENLFEWWHPSIKHNGNEEGNGQLEMVNSYFLFSLPSYYNIIMVYKDDINRLWMLL